MEHSIEIPLYSMIPFFLMLGSIAVLPLVANHFWELNKNKLLVSLILGVPVTIWLLAMGMTYELEHAMLFDYIPFIILLGALFVITGGIFVGGTIKPTPFTNSIILLIGAVLASLMGTTGAAMLLIRPVILANKVRKNKVHTILFFLAIVANCGGLLTPLGDPPLFMMYLRGAPFEWFFNLVPEWLFVNLSLIIIYFTYDSYLLNKEGINLDEIMPKKDKKPIGIKGNLNFVWLLGVVLSVAFLNQNIFPILKTGSYLSFIREFVIIIMVLLSLKFTRQKIRVANHYSWEPIIEVAFLFLGIFITMVPVLSFVGTHAKSLGIDTPRLFYYATGGLSGFLDNTPTAVTFHSLAKGLSEAHTGAIVAGIPEIILKAISVASVFFGSMTYIGNGPNFMVKAIAESQEINMPNFFAYIIKFSLIILLPIFILVDLFFIG